MSKDESEQRERDDAEQGDDPEQRIEPGRANASRRTVLRGVAAGSVAGIGGFGGAQGQETTDEETTEGDETTTAGAQRPEFFEQGAEVGVRMVADGPLTAPTDFAVPGGDDDRRFVTDQTGGVYVITQDGISDEPFVDVSDRMVELGNFYGLYASAFQDYDERGLLGIDFHPNFAENRKFYLHYSAPPNETLQAINWDHFEVVSEFTASDDGQSADLDSERELLRIAKPQYNHNGGPMAFGPDDGYLYVPMGDGGGANDEMYGHAPDWYEANAGGNGQELVANLLGNVLRIDVDGGTAGTTEEGGGTTTAEGGETTTAAGEGGDVGGGRPYGIPEDNPFAGDESEARPEIYAYGFRNPYGISFDSQGRLFVSDAGQDLFEEANIVERGGNYGWNVKEGTHCFSTETPSQPPEECPSSEPDEGAYSGQEFRDPIVEYPHVYRGESEGIVIVGGYFYEQETVPNLNGKYIFGDWTKDPQREEPAGRLLAAADPGGAGETATETTTADETTTVEGDEQVVPRDRLWDMEELVVAGSDDGTLDWFVRQFGRDDDGEIYVLVSRRGTPQGETGAVLQIVPPGEGDGSATAAETTVGEGQETVADEGETTTEAGGQETVAGEGETATEVGEETTVEGDEETTVADDLGIIERDM